MMTKKEILETFKSLARSQGSYGRLLEQIKDNDEALTYLEEQNFKDSVDLVMFIEG